MSSCSSSEDEYLDEFEDEEYQSDDEGQLTYHLQQQLFAQYYLYLQTIQQFFLYNKADNEENTLYPFDPHIVLLSLEHFIDAPRQSPKKRKEDLEEEDDSKDNEVPNSPQADDSPVSSPPLQLVSSKKLRTASFTEVEVVSPIAL